MRRLSLWMRAHPVFGDSLIAGALLLFDLLLFVASAELDDDTGVPRWYVTIPLSIATTTPLVFRRRYPVPVAYGVLLASTVHAGFQLGASGMFASAICVYTVLVYAGRRHGLLYLLATVAVSGVQIVLQYRDAWVSMLIPTLLGLAFCCALAEFVGARRAYQSELEARLHLLENERDHAARIAVAEERSRIARELHDVVAHAVSVMVVQADGAGYAIKSNPDVAERAARTISETGRGALAELRSLLDVLRGESDEEPRVPQPGADALADLAARVRAADLRVDLDLEGDLADLPAGVSLGVYRIVQESLTNTLKHAGNGAHATVQVCRQGDAVEVEVRDDGAGGPALVSANGHDLVGGNGLIGMRERANVLGGTLAAGPADGRGWRVRATLPVRGAG